MLEETTKACPFCAETIKAQAKVCRYCKRDLHPKPKQEKWGLGLWLFLLFVIGITVFFVVMTP